jgi:S1-C subfamily serine protease
MSRNTGFLRVVLASLPALLAVLGLAAGVPPRTDPQPSLQKLKSLEYTKVATTHEGGTLGYAELWELINAGKAYAKGVEILPRFHEPIPTRGETGIAVFKKASPSVVMVVTANFKDDKITDSGLGTGVIIDTAGDVLTNWHVIHGFETGIIFLKPTTGTEPDKNDAYGMKLISQNEQADLALLRMIKPPAGLVPVSFGDSSSIQVAEDIHIIGHPHGQLWSYSTGVVSQVRNNFDWHYADGSKHVARVLQMQTAINPGNSGGPVLDNNAKMLGLVAMSEEGQNLNYAVAVDVIKEFVNKALASKTRGGDAPTASPKAESFIAHTEDGLTVVKTVYADLVSYIVRDSRGVRNEQIALSADGDLLTGSKFNEFGGFSEWIFKPSSGGTVSIKSSGVAPDRVNFGEPSH